MRWFQFPPSNNHDLPSNCRIFSSLIDCEAPERDDPMTTRHLSAESAGSPSNAVPAEDTLTVSSTSSSASAAMARSLFVYVGKSATTDVLTRPSTKYGIADMKASCFVDHQNCSDPVEVRRRLGTSDLQWTPLEVCASSPFQRIRPFRRLSLGPC